MANPYLAPNQPAPGYYGPVYQQPIPRQPPPPSFQHPIPYLQPPNVQPYGVYATPPFEQHPPSPVQPCGVPAAPPFQQHSPSPTSRNLHIQNAGLAEPRIQIVDSLTQAPLYSISIPKVSSLSLTSGPPIAVQSCLTNTTIATIKFHSMTEDVDLVVHGQCLKLKSSTWSSSCEIHSKVPGTGKLKWKNNNVMKGGDIKCSNQVGQVIARLEAATWGDTQKRGRFELGPTLAAGGALMDEIVISGIAMVEKTRKQQGNWGDEAIGSLEDLADLANLAGGS